MQALATNDRSNDTTERPTETTDAPSSSSSPTTRSMDDSADEDSVEQVPLWPDGVDPLPIVRFKSVSTSSSSSGDGRSSSFSSAATTESSRPRSESGRYDWFRMRERSLADESARNDASSLDSRCIPRTPTLAQGHPHPRRQQGHGQTSSSRGGAPSRDRQTHGAAAVGPTRTASTTGGVMGRYRITAHRCVESMSCSSDTASVYTTDDDEEAKEEDGDTYRDDCDDVVSAESDIDSWTSDSEVDRSPSRIDENSHDHDHDPDPDGPIVTSCVTLCEPCIPPHSISLPHALYPRVARCRDPRKAKARPPIFLPPNDAIDNERDGGFRPDAFTAFGARFRLCAGAIDTRCRAEAAEIEIPPKCGLPSLVNLSSDVMLCVWSGRGAVTVNGMQRPLESGTFSYVRKGSSHSISNRESGASVLRLFAVWTSPGSLGFYKDVARHEQTSREGGTDDSSSVEALGKEAVEVIAAKYCFRILAL